jgi:ABC-type transport system involved in cytochrome c biogenesis permease subunit
MEQAFLKTATSKLKIISIILLLWALIWFYLIQFFDADRSQQSKAVQIFGVINTDLGCCNNIIANGIAK